MIEEFLWWLNLHVSYSITKWNCCNINSLTSSSIRVHCHHHCSPSLFFWAAHLCLYCHSGSGPGSGNFHHCHYSYVSLWFLSSVCAMYKHIIDLQCGMSEKVKGFVLSQTSCAFRWCYKTKRIGQWWVSSLQPISLSCVPRESSISWWVSLLVNFWYIYITTQPATDYHICYCDFHEFRHIYTYTCMYICTLYMGM